MSWSHQVTLVPQVTGSVLALVWVVRAKDIYFIRPQVVVSAQTVFNVKGGVSSVVPTAPLVTLSHTQSHSITLGHSQSLSSHSQSHSVTLSLSQSLSDRVVTCIAASVS
jgi:hypothetical protein